MKSMMQRKAKVANLTLRPVNTTTSSRRIDKRAMTARGSNPSSQVISPDTSHVKTFREDAVSKVSKGGIDKCSTSKAKSPLQCAEMVFGNLSNPSNTDSPNY